ncbi:hypothetical protein F511_17794 [Dorcoceras hygrometricum]|uniref:Uncharacterized protein n=1 Tax=Dorcoceras hygrometricum TaxID=472368 RepID=A0A2Z7BHW7_9LAMI|nr:hypothetical protein F511_17794 [Dorcoceras hygrometricum]
MTEFDKSFSSMIELETLGKEYTSREVVLKVTKGSTQRVDAKHITMREFKDLNKLELHDLFVDPKSYELELENIAEGEPSTSQFTKTLVATSSDESTNSNSSTETEKEKKDSIRNLITTAPAATRSDSRKLQELVATP